MQRRFRLESDTGHVRHAHTAVLDRGAICKSARVFDIDWTAARSAAVT
jgi:hypothetical protein